MHTLTLNYSVIKWCIQLLLCYALQISGQRFNATRDGLLGQHGIGKINSVKKYTAAHLSQLTAKNDSIKSSRKRFYLRLISDLQTCFKCCAFLRLAAKTNENFELFQTATVLIQTYYQTTLSLNLQGALASST